MALPPYSNEVYLDWTDETNQNAMRTALQRIEGELGKSYPLIIGGREVETDGEITSVNPAAPSQLVGHVASATVQEADMALETATKTFETWSRTAPEARARILLRAAATMRRRKFELLAWEVYEGGKPWAEADAQVAEAIDFLEYYAREMLRLKDGKGLYSVAGEENQYFYGAMGVGVIIAPWNFPTAILTGMSSAAIVTGNTIVLKPSEYTSVIGAQVAEIFAEAGLPEGVLELLPRLRQRHRGLSGGGRPDALYLLYRFDADGAQDKRVGGQAAGGAALDQARNSRDGRKRRPRS